MGSTLFLLDKDHEIQKTYRYDAFGAIKEETGEISNRLTFTGQMYDGETGQYYLRARFYNPSIGRFTQEDIYRGDGLNLYAYCANNPVMYYDPSGYVRVPLCVGGKTAAQCETFDEVQYFMRVSQAPKDDKGTWVSGIRGEGLFIPSDKKILDLLINEYGVTGVWYTHGVPDFSPFAVEEFKLYGMQGGKNGRKYYNFPQSDEIMGAKYGMTKQQFQNARESLDYTWHECNDMITMQMIPKSINSYFGHLGGVGEINLLNQQSIKTIWKKFPNWKK